ncbi:MAG: hypothetical protein WA141_01125 [Methanothrix sp.]|uniref:hypothetical protein n=2 Tax=Methanothrix sp. TaxID=90426 RepID=UPI003BB56EAF
MVKPDRSRYVHVYMPSDADKARWAEMAANAKTPLSKWVIEIVESTLAENDEFRPRREMVKELDNLKADVKTLRDELRQKNIVLERYEYELKHFRSQAFLEDNFKGTRRYAKEIVDILKARGHLDSYKLLEELGIDLRDGDLVKAVTNQLEELEGYKLVKTDGRTWTWIG